MSLLPTAAFKAAWIATPAPPSPFGNDPDRSQEMAPTDGAALPTAAFKAAWIATPAPPSPFGNDPDRSQELPPTYGP
jgi:hypothetical protein